METLKFLRRAHEIAVPLAKPLSLNELGAQNRAILLLYGTILELSGAFTLLCENRLWTGAPSIARSALEAYVDYLNICADEKYIGTLHLDVQSEHLRTLKAAEDTDNPFFADLRATVDLKTIISATEQQINKLKNEGLRRISIRSRFQKANLDHTYLSIYRTLSDEAHNNIATLYSKHLQGNKGLQFTLYQNEQRRDPLPLIDLIAGIVTHCTINTHEILRTGELSKVEILRNELETIRKSYGLG